MNKKLAKLIIENSGYKALPMLISDDEIHQMPNSRLKMAWECLSREFYFEEGND